MEDTSKWNPTKENLLISSLVPSLIYWIYMKIITKIYPELLPISLSTTW